MSSLLFILIVSFLLVAAPGRFAIERLRKLGARQNISMDAPTTHSAKQGTPTMGGLLILFSLTVTVGAYWLYAIQTHTPDASGLFAVLLLTLAFGVVGFIDDFLSARRGRNLGFRAREKFLAQCLAAVAFVLWLAFHATAGYTTAVVLTPALGNFPQKIIDFGNWYYLLAILFLVGFSNATNITDGLDGLSSGVTIPICLSIAVLVVQSASPSLAVSLVALAGALAGFLWWNAHPAKVFMGDTCSLALGAALAGAAILAKCEVALIVASLVCWAELFSVIIQVTVFKYRKKQKGLDYAKSHRVFRRSPLHHHFEEIGWPETQVVTRFWIVSAICAAIALLFGRG